MRAFVFTDKSLSRQAGRFVWLEIDTEKPENAPFRKQFPLQALPTFFVVDPTTEKVALRWVGGATIPQLEGILEAGRKAVAASNARSSGGGVTREEGRGLPAGGADQALARADRLYGEGDNAGAAKAYQEALALAPAVWATYGRAVESLLFALQRIEDYESGAKLARDAFPKLVRTASAANVAASGLDCALELAVENTQRQELVAALEADACQVVGDAAIPVAADDRSAVFASLVQARKDAEDDLGAKEVAAGWAAFLESEAARAETAERRTVFDSHRLSAYLELGEPERAIPMLEASERDLPDDYNPPARLATTYKALKRWDEALAASDRALAKVYGPRQIGLLQTRSDIHVGRGDTAAARSTLEDALRVAEALPPGQKSEAAIAGLKKKIAALVPAATVNPGG